MRWLIAAALLWPGIALADPITIVATLAPVIGGTAAAVVANAAIFLSAYGGYVYAAAQVYGGIRARRKAKQAAARARARYNASLADRFVTALTADPPWRIVYGRAITGGDLVAILTSDKTGTRDDGSSYTKPDGYKHLVIALAAHEVEAIHEVYIEGIAVGTLDGSGWATGGEFGGVSKVYTMTRTIAASGFYDFPAAPTVLSAGYYSSDSWVDVTPTVSGVRITNPSAQSIIVSVSYTVTTALVRVEKAMGTDAQTASAYLQSVSPSEWTTSDRLRGIAYIVVTLDLEEQRFAGGPPQITADISGKKLYDPRTTTTVWSNNPALVVRDWLLGEYGFAADAADIDDTSVIAAANACDEMIDLVVGATTTADQARYTCDGMVTTDQAPEAVLEDMANSMAGFAAYTGGTWVVVAGTYTAPVLALTEANESGPIEIVQAGTGFDELFNGVRGQMVEAGRLVPSEFDAYSNATYVTADGEDLWVDVDLPWTNDRARARNLARILTEQARDSLVIRYPATLHAWPLQVGDRVTVTSTEYGWTAKVFRVTDWQFDVSSPVVLTLQEDAEAIYDLADAATEDQAPNTGLPNPWAVPAIAGLAADSGDDQAVTLSDASRVPRVKVTWTAVSSAYVTSGGYVDVRWRRVQDVVGQWQVVRSPGGETDTYLIGMQVGDQLVIGIRAVNSLGALGPEAFIGHEVEAITEVYTGDLNATYGADASNLDVTLGSGNLLPNGSFEADSDGDGAPDSWSSQSFGTNISIAKSLSTFAPLFGKSFFLNVTAITSPTSAAQHYFIQDDASKTVVQPSTTYTLSCWARTSNAAYGARLGIAWYDSSNALIGSVDYLPGYTFGGVSRWERIVGSLTSPANAAYARVRGGIVRPSTSDTTLSGVRFDGMQLEAGDVATGFVPREVGTSEIYPEAATTVTEDEETLSGTSYGNGAIPHTLTITPESDCVIEFTSFTEFSGLFGDSGNRVDYKVTPSGGSAVTLTSASAWDTDRRVWTKFASYAATGGVALTFDAVVSKGSGTILGYTSRMRVVEVKR